MWDANQEAGAFASGGCGTGSSSAYVGLGGADRRMGAPAPPAAGFLRWVSSNLKALHDNVMLPRNVAPAGYYAGQPGAPGEAGDYGIGLEHDGLPAANNGLPTPIPFGRRQDEACDPRDFRAAHFTPGGGLASAATFLSPGTPALVEQGQAYWQRAHAQWKVLTWPQRAAVGFVAFVGFALLPKLLELIFGLVFWLCALAGGFYLFRYYWIMNRTAALGAQTHNPVILGPLEPPAASPPDFVKRQHQQQQHQQHQQQFQPPLAAYNV